jgi:hypothetical protein
MKLDCEFRVELDNRLKTGLILEMYFRRKTMTLRRWGIKKENEIRCRVSKWL